MDRTAEMSDDGKHALLARGDGSLNGTVAGRGLMSAKKRRLRTSELPYRAFLSYSHAVDGRLAPALQSALHRFAKPWYQLRAIRVFHDEASLSANPGLWSSIETALNGSEFFILLASPEAAASEWVDREVAWWVANKDRAKLLIVLTAGEMAWDRQAGRFDRSRTTALPPSLHDVFTDEPRYVDLRWAAHEDHLSMDDPRFRDCVADIAAPLHGRPKDELFGEDVRQHRRALRLARTVGVALAVLALFATTAAVVAVQKQRQATAQARVAISRQLGVTANDIVDAQFDLALLLAVEAVRTRDTPQARASLFSVLERNPQHVAFLNGAEAMTVVRISPDGKILAAGDVNGAVRRWHLPDVKPAGQVHLPSPSAVESLAVAPDGSRLAAGAKDGQVVVWDADSGKGHQALRHDRAVRAVTFSPDGRWVASGDAGGAVLVADTVSGNQIGSFRLVETSGPREDSPVAVRGLSFSLDGRQVSAAGRGLISTWDVGSGRLLSQREPAWSPSVTDSAFSHDLALQAESIGKGGYSLGVSRTDGQRSSSMERGSGPSEPTLLPGDPDILTFSPDARLLAAAGEGAVRLFQLEPLQPHPDTPVLTGYPSAVTSMSISADRRWLAVASGNAIVLSDLTRRHRLARVVAEPGDVCGTCSGGNTVSISPDGRLLAWLDDRNLSDGSPPRVRLWDLARNAEVQTFSVDGSGTIAFDPDGRSLVSASPASVWDLQGNRLAGAPADRRSWSERGLAVAFTSSGTGLVLSAAQADDFRWRLVVRDAGSGQMRYEGPPADDMPVAALSSRGVVAFAGADGSITLWDVQHGRAVGVLAPTESLAGAASTVDDLAFDADGSQLASLAGGTVTVWDVSSRRTRFTLRAGSRGTLRFAPDGSRLGTAAQDGTLTVWELPSRQLLATVKGQSPYNGFPHIAFSPDGRTLASVVPGGGLVLADMNPRRWLREACAIAGRDLTASERESFTGGGLAPRSACS